MNDQPHTVYVCGEVPSVLSHITCSNLPTPGEKVRVVISSTNHFVGWARVIRVNTAANTYDIDTCHMTAGL